jgi:hypothetical protein
MRPVYHSENRQNALILRNLRRLERAAEDLDAMGVTIISFSGSTMPVLTVEEHAELATIRSHASGVGFTLRTAIFRGCHLMWENKLGIGVSS